MDEPQNVQIPLALFKKVIGFLEWVNIKNYELPSIYNFGGMLEELREKQHRINMRGAYSSIIHSQDEGSKRSAISDYVKIKNRRK